MEKEKILSTLKEKLGKTSLSDKTIDNYVNNVLPAEGTEPDDAYFAAHVSILKSLEGQFNHDVATRVEDFKKNYKPTIPTPSPEPKPDPKPSVNEELEKRLKLIEEQMQTEKQRLAIESIRKQVLDESKGLNIANKNLFEDCVKNLAINEQTKVEDAVKIAKSEYESKLKLYVGDFAQPYTPGAPGADETTKALDDYFARKAQEGKFPEKH